MFRDSATIARNVHSQVADRIGALIVRGDVLPGDPLPSEVKICEMLDVSRTVVRTAIRTLTGGGQIAERRLAAVGASDDLLGDAFANRVILTMRDLLANTVERHIHVCQGARVEFTLDHVSPLFSSSV